MVVDIALRSSAFARRLSLEVLLREHPERCFGSNMTDSRHLFDFSGIEMSM